MPPTPLPDYPPNITEQERESLTQAARDWCLANGLAVKPPPGVIPPEADPEGLAAVPAPVTLFPSAFPSEAFAQAKAVQRAYNELYAKISLDEAFLAQVTKDVAAGDDFIASLWDVHIRVQKEGYTHSHSLGLFRSDYMVHQDESGHESMSQVKQVEFNTIASSFGGLSVTTSKLHKFLAEAEYPLLNAPVQLERSVYPENESAKGLADGLKAAFEAYGASDLGHPRCILFLVQGGERNIFDQRHIEYHLVNSKPSIPVFRLLFADILKHTALADTPKRQLIYRVPSNTSKVFEVSVVYLRSGYGPSDYPNQSAWDARYHIERSSAIKCPTVLLQLAGTKKVQQLLATPKESGSTSVLGRFIPDNAKATEDLRKTFTNIYPMDDSPAGLEAVKLALDPETCKRYVLKPQREGGGNNTYRSAIPDFLKSISKQHWASYILMELITPPPVSNMILRNGHIEEGGVICELGIYGTCLWSRNGEVVHNEEVGYLLRTKGDQSEEGGVAAGYGCMDSCNLV